MRNNSYDGKTAETTTSRTTPPATTRPNMSLSELVKDSEFTTLKINDKAILPASKLVFDKNKTFHKSAIKPF